MKNALHWSSALFRYAGHWSLYQAYTSQVCIAKSRNQDKHEPVDICDSNEIEKTKKTTHHSYDQVHVEPGMQIL